MIKVMVVDDSAYNRVTISKLLDSARDIRVVATAVNGEDAIRQVMKHRPDVITLDLEMPVMDGFAFLRWLMVTLPTPVIAVSSRSSDRSVFKALELGAVDFVAKPGGRISAQLEQIGTDLIASVRQCSQIRIENVSARLARQEEAPPAIEDSGRAVVGIELVVIGCSTGGPPAIQFLLETLPLLPIPFVIAQHMPATFTRLFAERVNKLTPYTVKEAQDGEVLQPGFAYVAPGGCQTEVVRSGDRLRVATYDALLEDLYAPSVDRLFSTASDACGPALIAVVMTGMGDDGAGAIRKVRENGGRTLAEAESSAVIFGMPAAAIRTGCIEMVAPLAEIPSAIQRFCWGP
jgi:two-component system chemotaxis response regulator CheB